MSRAMHHSRHRSSSLAAVSLLVTLASVDALGHGTVVSPVSRVYRVYQSNPENPNFALAANAVAIDGKLSYYTWNEVSRNIPQAVQAGLPAGFDYSPWMPDGQLASAGRVDPQSSEYPRTYAGLDQVSVDWPKSSVTAGESITVDWYATAVHDPSVWDVWMTTPDWVPTQPLTWAKMEFLGRPNVSFSGGHFTFDVQVPADRSGHHVLWVAWQRNDPVGEVFISTSDLEVTPGGSFTTTSPGCGGATLTASGTPKIGGVVQYAMTGDTGATQLLWVGAAPTSVTMCTGCTVGTPIGVVLPKSFSATIPVQPSLVGVSYHIQGADITGTSGGCNYVGGIDFTLTETIRTDIGG